jgi:glycosyltransferase involved in cell wall biosynthesis
MVFGKQEIGKRISDSYEVPNRVLEEMPWPMVTVRTSTYQHAPYIKQCIEGVLMQETSFPFEYIIGEDFSTDGTREIVFGYAKRYPDKIRVITADYNVGMKANGLRCIEASRGKYMALCEGDDYWTDPLKLQKQVNFLEENDDYVMCYHDAMVIGENGNIIATSKMPEHNRRDYTREELILGRTNVLTLSLLYRNILKEVPEESLTLHKKLGQLVSIYLGRLSNYIQEMH